MKNKAEIGTKPKDCGRLVQDARAPGGCFIKINVASESKCKSKSLSPVRPSNTVVIIVTAAEEDDESIS